MNVEPTSLVTLGVAIFGAGGTWMVMGYRVRRLESERRTAKAAATELAAKVEELGKTLEHVRQSQGGRLGAVEDKLSDVRGRAAILETWFAAGVEAARRKKHTAPAGHPVAALEPRSSKT